VCETLSLTLREKLRLRVAENRELRNVFRHKRDEITGRSMWQVWETKGVHTGPWW